MEDEEVIARIQRDLDEDVFEGRYDAESKRKFVFISILIAVSLFTMLISITLGAVNIPLIDVINVFMHPILPQVFAEPSMDYYNEFIFRGRMPRVFMVALTGFSLGLAGMIMQGLLRNPLVSPFTLGVSTAASFGAALSIMFGPILFGAAVNLKYNVLGVNFYVDDLLQVLFAFLMALASIGIILLMTRGKDISRSTVILSGVVISYLFQAGIMACKYFSDEDELREITMWIMGSFTGSTWGGVLILVPIVIICCIALISTSMDINALAAGDDVASSLGVDVTKLRRDGLVISTMVTAACLSFTGVIGFIGLMAPHICRMIIGNDARYLSVCSGLMGIAILSLSDLFCRLIIRPGELPVGIVLYIIGGMFFVWMVGNRRWSKRL